MRAWDEWRFRTHVPPLDNPPDSLGFPSRLILTDISRPHDGRREYAPKNRAMLRVTESGRVYCTCCGRELKRAYLANPSLRFCPRCGAEVMR